MPSRCQEDGCEADAVVGVGYRVKWVCPVHHEEYLGTVRGLVDEAMSGGEGSGAE